MKIIIDSSFSRALNKSLALQRKKRNEKIAKEVARARDAIKRASKL